MKVEVIVNGLGVDVFADGQFCGGITRERISEGTAAVAEGVYCILLNVSEAANRPFSVSHEDVEHARKAVR